MNPFKTGKHPLSATGMLTPQEFDTPAKLFMRSGKNHLENILKSQIENKQVADALADLVSQYAFFGLDAEDGPQMRYINTLVVCWAAVRSRASIFALQGVTTIMSEHLTAAAAGIDVRDTGRQDDKKDDTNNTKSNSREAT
ncbi:MAG TPA: hypothetical protein VM537_01855 [Anaerolineae bacterium]|nr:hypothetical protein [Anaerolineae bacterium]